MRTDSIGLFWEDLPTGRGARGPLARPMPEIPETGWRAPRDFPNLSAAKAIAFDTETFDPDLGEYGPGWARGVGHVIGASVAVEGGYKWYFPFGHETCPEQNLDKEQVLRWLRDTLGNPLQRKIGANITYDMGWLRQEGVHVAGELFDVQFAEALLDESAEVNLEALGYRYLGEGKTSNLLYQWLADWFGGAPTGVQRKHLYKAPPSLAGPYAEGDADLPLRLEGLQTRRLIDEGLWPVFRMECDLIRLIIDIRFNGVRVDLNKAEEAREYLLEKETAAAKYLASLAGFDVNTNSSSHLAKAFDAVGEPYPRTAKNTPSFTKAFLEEVTSPIGKAVVEVRKLNKLRTTFIESYVLDSNIKGRLYGQFHLLRGDSEGTRSGRMSSSTPNLQNLPSKDTLAAIVRGCFVPDIGHRVWKKFDYSQIEYRFLAHFAVGAGSDDIRAVFNNNPDADYHQAIIDLIYGQTGIELERKPAKTINFGLIYGMGQDKLGHSLHLDKKATKELFEDYHKGAPFAKATMQACSEEASNTGSIKTFLGRKSRFDLWEPGGWGKTEKAVALPMREALLRYGKIRRAYVHKALNRKLQGSAADLMKMALWQLYHSGVFAYTGVPSILVHDEGDWSDPGGQEEGFSYIKHVMETVAKLRVPVKVDLEEGPDWGHVKEL